METITYSSLIDKLKNAPQSILEKVSKYVDALLDENINDFVLSENQKNILDSQENLAINQYLDADELYYSLKEKNEL